MRKVFVWRPRNIEHIAKHGVSPQEAKYVVEHASRRYPQRIGEGRYIVRGRTAGGRAIQVIFLVLSDDAVDVELLDLVERMLFEEGNEVLYVIHARDLSRTESRSI
jgi:uncharacterized DUF497 family protein